MCGWGEGGILVKDKIYNLNQKVFEEYDIVIKSVGKKLLFELSKVWISLWFCYV